MIRCMVLVVFLVMTIGGCQATHLVYVHNAVLGVDVTASADAGTVRFALGYDRETYAMVPKKKGQGEESEAMSLTAVSRVHVEGMSNIEFGHAIATGKAAKKLAESPAMLSRIVNEVFGKGDGS